MIQILIEAIIVSIYCLLLFLIINSITFNKLSIYQELFIIGFFKHLIGYYSNIHKYYCNYYIKSDNKNHDRIIIESLAEGFVFLIFGLIINIIINYKKNKIYFYLIIGFSLHIIAEILKIHKLFCKI